MEPRTNQILLPKHIYLDFIHAYVVQNPGNIVCRVPGSRRDAAAPFELRDKTGKVLMTYERWYSAVKTYFEHAREQIILGRRLQIMFVGNIYAKRIQRNYRKKVINWNATNKVEKVVKNGKLVSKYNVYHTDPDYCRIAWERRMRGNKRPRFKFTPTHSSKTVKGFKQQFSDALKSNPHLKFKYVYNAYKYGI